LHVKRPLGITIISVLLIINGSFLLLSGLSTFVLLTNFSSNFEQLSSSLNSFDIQNSNSSISNEDFQRVMANFDYYLYLVGIILLSFALIHFFIAYGLLKAKSWARKTTIIIALVGIFINILIILIAFTILNISGIVDTFTIFGGNIFTILLNVIIIYYLTKKEVKEFFIFSQNKSFSDSFSSLDDLR
jgi:ABC-type spermidine/putrescine transport system permease subunit I